MRTRLLHTTCSTQRTPLSCLLRQSYSRRLLDEDEAAVLLSGCSTALASTRLPWPLLLPVADGLRDAYIGCCALQGGGLIRLSTDSIHISRLPQQLLLPQVC